MKFMMTAAVRLLAPSKYCNCWQEPFSKSRPLQGDFFLYPYERLRTSDIREPFRFCPSDVSYRIVSPVALPCHIHLWCCPVASSARGAFFCRIEALPVGTFAALAAVLLVAFVISGRFLFTSRKNFAKNPKTDIGSAASGGR